MADLTKCGAVTCPRAEYCYRHTALDSIWQSYFAIVPLNDDGSCDQFIHNRLESIKDDPPYFDVVDDDAVDGMFFGED
jgi:hypothetical protein